MPGSAAALIRTPSPSGCCRSAARITVDRKYREAWTARLQIRFLILSNELARLVDASGALGGRFIVLVLIHSFYGREDLGLTDRLLTELPGIFNWTIAGWQRLSERGHFAQPNSALDAVRQLEDSRQSYRCLPTRGMRSGTKLHR